MDHVGKIQRRKNPRETANFFSLLSFWYTKDLFSKSLKKDLEEDDVYDVTKTLRAKPNADRFEKEWKKCKETKSSANLLLVLWNCFGWYYLFLGFVHLSWNLLSTIYEPEAISKLVDYFKSNKHTVSYKQALFWGGVKIALRFGRGIYMQNYMVLMQHLAIRMRTSFCSLVYRKALKLTPEELNRISLGNVITIITKDVAMFEHNMLLINDLWISIIKIIVICYLIYNKMGWCGFVGIGTIMVIVPLQIYVTKLIKNLRLDLSTKTDQRLQATQETLSSIKIIKMYTWEKIFSDKVEEKRRQEMLFLMRSFYLRSANMILGMLTSKIGFYLLIMVYIAVTDVTNSATIFYVMKCFGDIRMAMTIVVPMGMGRGAEVYASMLRINLVLDSEELEDNSVEDYDRPKIVLKNTSVKIKDNYILKNVSTRIEKGMVIVTGPLGCGKSSLLKLFLNDFPVDEGKVHVRGTFSYSSQDPWLFPSSIKQNITFGQPLDEKRYQEVVRVCALQYDFNMFEKGDETIVADRGINLSGGQQARINLARAIYKQSDIYLLDDPLHALDPNVQDYIFHNCILEFLKGSIVVFVTHNLRHKNSADRLIVMDGGGTIKYDGKPLEASVDLIKEIEMDESKKEVDENDKATEDSKLLVQDKKKRKVYSEVKKTGKVDSSVYRQYFSYGGGILLFAAIFLMFVVGEFGESYSSRLLTDWINVTQDVSDIKHSTNQSIPHLVLDAKVSKAELLLNLYSAMIIGSFIMDLIKQYLFINFARKASVNLHNEMIEKLTTAKMSFYDNYFIGNILNRFSQDLTKIDEHLPHTINSFTRIVLSVVGIIGVITSVHWTFSIPAIVLIFLMVLIQQIYMPCSRSLKRLESGSRSPLIGHLNSTMEGITTIRAFKAQNLLSEEFDRHQELYISAYYMTFCVNKAFGFCMEILASIFLTFIVGTFLLFDTGVSDAYVGLAITRGSMLAALVQFALMQMSDLENDMTSVERVLEYTNVSQDIYKGTRPVDWPNKGSIQFKEVSLTYKSEEVLKNISFEITPRQKIGIVGRTGAGKSSIISTLFRLYNFDGTVTIDGVDTKTVALAALRNHISIIPQDPLLFQGTIRRNLDPYDKFADDEIWSTLELVHMRDHIPALDLLITDHGSNFSTGQRQLICLARAIMKKNRIVVLDEATANMDPDTEVLAQKAIDNNFADCTVFIIAHRLQAVMNCDRIIVMDKGRIIEFDHPNALLANKHSHFSKMLATDSAPSMK